MKKLHLILTGFTFILLLLSFNRLTGWFIAPLPPYDFLRWLDFNAMLPIPLAMIILYYLVKRNVQNSTFAQGNAINLLYPNLLFIIGVYIFGASAGDHEVTNYLSTLFCGRGTVESEMCAIVSYHDDIFSHVLYFTGAIAMQAAVLWIEYRFPRKQEMRVADTWLITANASFIALGIFVNLAFEETAIDIAAFLFVLLFSVLLLWRQRRQWRQVPFIFYTAVAYAAGVGATIIAKLLQ